MQDKNAQDELNQSWMPGSPLLPGVRLREYIITGKLNSGTFGSIFRAYQPAVDREVAIKVILPRFANQSYFMESIETEARTVARLEHPHIVPLYDFWRDDGGAYIVMRWLRRGSLETRMDEGPFSVEELLRLVDQIASALSETHKQGIIHRDLKPSNILLDEQGNAYLSDFGIATAVGIENRKQSSEGLMGSPAYISPEQLYNDPVSPQSDIYSLSIIIFELLTGNLPFKSDDFATLVQQHLHDPLPSVLDYRSDLSPAIDWVLGRAAAKKVDARYPDVQALSESLRQVLAPHAAAGSNGPERRPLPLAALNQPRAIQPIFVGRERQLQGLHNHLDEMLSGHGQFIGITGGAGRGKTSLINEFARQAMELKPDLLVAAGRCNVFSAAGDPYLPFRQILAMLTGDIEAERRAGTVSEVLAHRLQTALPVTIDIIIDKGSDLLDVLIPANALLNRARTIKDDKCLSAERLEQLIVKETLNEGRTERKRLFTQFTAVFLAISQIHPLILILDDLQWIDKTSASLLFHLSRHIAGQRLLIICAYRREEVSFAQDGQRHPMDKLLGEVKRNFGSTWINLGELKPDEEKQFVNRLLDQEPNKLGQKFRQSLFRHTSGHALFTVELLRAMQDRGDLLKNEAGEWIEGATLDWKQLPPRIEGVIEERIGRLSPELRSLLNIASVEGQQFTAEITASVEEKPIGTVLRQLSQDLEGLHRLVEEQEEVRIGQNFLTRFQFSHVLIQQYLYDKLGSGERRLIHAQIAQNLQDIVQDSWHPFAAELAWHWQQAGRRDKAVDKWLWLGDQARTSYAHAEAENFYKKAVTALQEQGNLETSARTLMKLGLIYTADFQPEKAQEAYNQAFFLWYPAQQKRSPTVPGPSVYPLRLATVYPVSFDPGLIDDDVSTFLIAQLFEGLVRVGQEQNVLPAAAHQWEVQDGGTRYIFHIRKNAVWNDGTPLTAKDFVFAWNRNLHPKTHSPSAHLLFVVKNARDFAEGKIDDTSLVGVSALDLHTLEVKLERPTAYFPYLLAHTVAFPQPQHVVKTKSETWSRPNNLISNGPFQVSSVESDNLTLTRNPNYLGQFSGNVETVLCSFIEAYDAVLHDFHQDKLDIVNLIHADPDTIARAGSLFGNNLVSIPRWSTFYLCFRCDRPPFNDVRVRQALALALDRETLAVEGFQGLRQAATGGFVPPGMPGHSPNIALPFDPQRARNLLAQAGFADGFRFPEVEWATAPGGERVISFIQRAWHDNLNLNFQPKVMNWEAIMEKISRDPAQLTILGWGSDIPDPENMLRATFHSQEGVNIPHWHNERFNALTDEAEQVMDHAQRMAMYMKADQILVAEETAVLPLSYALGKLLVKPWVQLPVTPAISMSLRFATVVRPE